jgi:hypothetical protein
MERQLKQVAETSEQRVQVLRDAIADFVAAELEQRDEEMASLKNQIADLERQLQQKTAVDQLVNEAVARLDSRQLARDEARRGKTGRQGERGARGERGPAGARGPAGKPATLISIHSWHIDAAKFRVTPFLDNGQSLPHIELMPLFKAYFEQTTRNEDSS